MPEVPFGQFMNCADGRRRASVGVLFGSDPATGDLSPIIKTASYTVTATQSAAGVCFSNEGAGGAVIFTLPPPFKGNVLHFTKETAQNVTIAASAGTTINGAATIANTASEAANALITLVGISATKWKVYSKAGTWS